MSAVYVAGIAALVFQPAAQAANTIYTNGSTTATVSGNWDTVTWTKTGTATTNTFPTTTDAGNVAQNLGTANTTSTSTVLLDVPVTIGALYVGSEGTTIANWTLSADGVATHIFTLDGTNLSAANQAFGNAGVAAIATRSGGTLTVNPNVVMATGLDVGTTSNQNGNLTINGNITASAASGLNFRGSTANANVNGIVTINGSIGASGSAIAVSNLRSSASGTSGNVLINGNLGPSVSGVTQNGVATMILAGTNTYTGTTTITSGTLQVGNGGTTGTLPTGSAITDNGNLTFNRSNTMTQGIDFSTAGITGTGSLTLAGTGMTIFTTSANSYSGVTTINAGATLQLGATGGSTGNISGTSSIVDNGNLTISRTSNTTQGTTLGGTGAIISGAGSFTQAGTGTTTFNVANTYTGTTAINRGTLNLGGSTTNGSISSSSALALGGGTLSYTRTGGTTQTFASTTVNPGGSAVVASVSGDTLALGAITRNVGGTVDFSGTGTITTGNANGSGAILGGYATYGKNDWATVSSGNVVAFTGYTAYDNVATWPGNVDNKDVTDDTSATGNTSGGNFDGSYTNSETINSLRFNNGTADGTVNINGFNNLTISSGGILVTANVGVKYERINGGGLTTGSSTDLVIQQNNTSSGHLQIGSSIFGSGGLTKAGVGQLDLNGSDATYTGVTTVNGGTVMLTAGITGTTAVVVNNSGTVLLGANDRINDAATVMLNGGTVNTGGFQEGRATGTAAATQGLGALTLSSSSTLDFGSGHAGSSVLAFANSSGQTWSGTLTLTDFVVGTDELNFGSMTGLTATQLAEISLGGFTATGLDSYGDVTFASAVPEPATVLGGALFVSALGWRKRRVMGALLGSLIA